MGTSRSAFGARSISFASLVRLLPSRLRWVWEGNNVLGMRVCGVGCTREESVERQASMNQTQSTDGKGSFYSPQDSPAQRSCLWGQRAQQSTHAAAGTRTCADERGLHEGFPLHAHHSAPQWASTRTYAPPICIRPLHAMASDHCTQWHHHLQASLGG